MLEEQLSQPASLANLHMGSAPAGFPSSLLGPPGLQAVAAAALGMSPDLPASQVGKISR